MHRQSGEFILNQQNGSEDGTPHGAGACFPCDADEMKEHGPDYANQLFNVAGGASEIETASAEKQNVFYKTHRAVWVCRPEPDEVLLWPMRPVFEGDEVISVYLAAEDASHLPWPIIPEKFFESLMAAFEIAQ
jgi:hypothetical protein